MKTSILGVLALLSAAPAAWAVEVKHNLSPVPAGLDAAEFELWIPDTLPSGRPVRGILGSSNYHAGAGVYDSAEWRAIATQYDLAILRYRITSGGNPIDTSRAGANALLQALREMAPMAGRPEIEFAGIIPTGLSWAALQVCAFTSYIPERVICAVPFRATAHDISTAASSAASRGVPLLHLSAGREVNDGYKPSQAQAGHAGLPAQGARFAMIVQLGEEHHILGDLSYLKIWFEEVMPLRIPASIPVGTAYTLLPITVPGWSGEFDIQTMADAPWNGGEGMVNVRISSIPAGGTAPTAAKSWLPSQRLAEAWLSYAETGQIGNVPPATNPDTDGDGLPDSWEGQYFGGLQQAAAGDPDGDGATNLQEYQVGTDPTSAPASTPPSGAPGGFPAVGHGDGANGDNSLNDTVCGAGVAAPPSGSGPAAVAAVALLVAGLLGRRIHVNFKRREAIE
jgi:MYXO-CTERM domain-containing protein